MWRVWGRGEGCTGFWWGDLMERDHWGGPAADGKIILRWIFRKWEGVVRTGWRWLRIGTGGGHLWVRWRTFGFQKCGEFLDQLQNQLASQEGLCSMEKVSTIHVSDRFSVHHQVSSKQSAKPVWHIPIAVYTALDSWFWTENLSETCRVLFQKYIWEIGASHWFYYKNM